MNGGSRLVLFGLVFLSFFVFSAMGCSSEDPKNDNTPVCGNDLAEEGEACDGTDLRSETCESLGLGEGTLACNSDCTYDRSGCESGPVCGNGILEAGESCDSTDLGGESCESLGLGEGTLVCDSNCEFDTTDCELDSVCGNDRKEDGEACDGEDLGGETCDSLGLGEGTLACREDCAAFVISQCSIDPKEMTWISIQGSGFEMGSTQGHPNERPIHTVTVPTFEMTKSQITVAQYDECVSLGPCTPPGTGWDVCNSEEPGLENHPVNCVDWFQAVEFCSWVGGRLPTEAEWEYGATSGGQTTEFPWGVEIPTCDYVVMDDGGGAGCGTGRTMPVCSKPLGETDQGLCDMAGNVWEWVRDCYHDSYDGAPDDGSAWEDPETESRVFRGGAFNATVPYDLRAAVRSFIGPSYYYDFLGFRCARTP